MNRHKPTFPVKRVDSYLPARLVPLLPVILDAVNELGMAVRLPHRFEPKPDGKLSYKVSFYLVEEVTDEAEVEHRFMRLVNWWDGFKKGAEAALSHA